MAIQMRNARTLATRRRVSQHMQRMLDEVSRHRLLEDERLWNEIACVETPSVRVTVADASLSDMHEALWSVQRSAIAMMTPADGYSHEAAFVDLGREKLTRAGNLFFAPAGKTLFRRSTPGRHRIVACSFDPEYCDRTVGSLEQLSPIQLVRGLDISSSAVLGPMMARIMREATQPDFISTALIESFGHAALHEWSCAVRRQQPEERGRGRLTPRHFGLIDEYLATCVGSPSVSAIAKLCGFSERYFAHLFKLHTQQSIGAYLKRAQIAKAKTLLRQTDLPLKEIAFRLGFNTPSNFSVAFRTATGETPGRFRNVDQQ